MVDDATKESILLPKITDPSPSPSYDFKYYYRSLVLTAWHNLWTNQLTNKLRMMKNKPTCHKEVILFRLRIGHILADPLLPPPEFPTSTLCLLLSLLVPTNFLQCIILLALRSLQQFSEIPAFDLLLPITLKPPV